MASPTPTTKSDVDPTFEKLFRALKVHAKESVPTRDKGQGALWMRPPGWSGDPFDYSAMHTPFDRAKPNDRYVDAVKDAANPGTVGDIAAASHMIDTLAVMERAFRVRQTLRGPRAMAHVLARQEGHGSDQGPLIQLGVEYVRNILTEAKE